MKQLAQFTQPAFGGDGTEPAAPQFMISASRTDVEAPEGESLGLGLAGRGGRAEGDRWEEGQVPGGL